MPRTEEHAPIQAAVETTRTNWAGNYTFAARQLVEPASVADLQALLPTLAGAKAVGTRHSFNHIADTGGTQISLRHFKSMDLDEAERRVTIGGGVTYGELAPFLHRRGFAVHNLASLPHISVAGACATATHGSGLGNGCLSTALAALELMTADGEIVKLSRTGSPDLFRMAAVSLGAFGVVVRLTLNVMPAFEVAQTVYENLSFDELPHGLREIFGAAYSVSLFTDWQHHRATQVWLKRKVDASTNAIFPATFFGATRQTAKLHPLPNLSAENCTEQQGIPGPWHERLPHFRLDYTPSAGAELQTEYFVPFEHALEAIASVEELRDRITPHLLISELRAVAADDLPMSMAFDRESLAIHFTWKQQIEPVLGLLPQIEARLEPFSARPHWGKLFATDPHRLRALYPACGRFEANVQELDPQGRFRNAFVAALLRQ